MMARKNHYYIGCAQRRFYLFKPVGVGLYTVYIKKRNLLIRPEQLDDGCDEDGIGMAVRYEYRGFIIF